MGERGVVTGRRVEEYAVWLRAQLLDPHIPPRERLVDAEVEALVSAVVVCARAILVRFVEQTGARRPRAHDVRAACVLARKAILGMDAEWMVDKQGDGRYDEWIVQHLQRNDWRACEAVERRVGELPYGALSRVAAKSSPAEDMEDSPSLA